jgi:flagellar M-ring protein FliF
VTPASQTTTDTETATDRAYELGREVAVTTAGPGALRKLSVAVAVSDKALKAAAPMTAQQLQALVSAAVGADAQRGDMVQVVASKFEPADLEPPAFYEQPWFAMLVRYATALIAVLLVLLLAVKPLIGKIRGKGDAAAAGAGAGEGMARAADDAAASEAETGGAATLLGSDNGIALGDLPRQVELARRLAAQQPERAVEALQRMLEGPDAPGPAAGAA